MGIEEYDPENEVDPVELQKEQISMGREFLDRLKKEDKKREAAEAAAKQSLAEYRDGPPRPAYAPPTFEETSQKLKRAWEEVKRVIPDAPDSVKHVAFQVLLSSGDPFAIA